MSKIGVGVGEDFPVDDGNGERDKRDSRDEPREGFQGDYDPRRDRDAAYDARREAHRKWRAARRQWHQQWKDEWRARRRDFHERYRDSYYDGHRRSYWRSYAGHPFFWGDGFLVRLVAVVAILAVVMFAFSYIYYILGGLVLLALFASAWRHGFDPFDLPPHDYRRDRDEPAPRKPPTEPPRDSAH